VGVGGARRCWAQLQRMQASSSGAPPLQPLARKPCRAPARTPAHSRPLTRCEQRLPPDRAHALLEPHAALPPLHHLGRQRRRARRHEHLNRRRPPACAAGARRGTRGRATSRGAAPRRLCLLPLLTPHPTASPSSPHPTLPASAPRPPKFHCHTLPTSAAPATRKVLRYHSTTCCCSSVGASGSDGSGPPAAAAGAAAACCDAAAAASACGRRGARGAVGLGWAAAARGAPARRRQRAQRERAPPHLLLLAQQAQAPLPGLLLVRIPHSRRSPLGGGRRSRGSGPKRWVSIL
jgi:hypothetical protein